MNEKNTTTTSRGWRSIIRGNVFAIGLVSLFTDASSEMIYPLLPLFMTGLVPVGLAAIYVGLMEGIAETTASFLKLFSGRLSDALGKRKALVVLGYGLSTISRPLMGFAGAGWQVVAMRFLDRIGKGIRTSPRDALIGDSVGPASRGLAFSFHRAMDHTGAVIGPLAAIGILSVILGYGLWRGEEKAITPSEMNALRWLFWISLIPGIAAMIALIGKVREIAPQKEDDSPVDKTVSPWRKLPAKFYMFVAIVTLFALGNSSDLFLLLYGKTKFNFGIAAILGLWIMLHISKVIFSFPGGVLSDRVGRRPIIIVGWIVYALVYLGMATVESSLHYCLLLAAYGFFYGMTEGVEKALVADFVDSGNRGTAYGIYHGAVGLAALPASLLFGVFWAVIGPQWAFGIGATLAGLASLLLMILISTSHRQ